LKQMFFRIRVTYTHVLWWEHTLPCRRACYWHGKSDSDFCWHIRVTYTQVLWWEHTLPCRRACYWYGKSGGHVRGTYTHVLGWEHTLPCHRACYWYGKSDNANEDMGFERSLLPKIVPTPSHRGRAPWLPLWHLCNNGRRETPRPSKDGWAVGDVRALCQKSTGDGRAGGGCGRPGPAFV